MLFLFPKIWKQKQLVEGAREVAPVLSLLKHNGLLIMVLNKGCSGHYSWISKARSITGFCCMTNGWFLNLVQLAHNLEKICMLWYLISMKLQCQLTCLGSHPLEFGEKFENRCNLADKFNLPAWASLLSGPQQKGELIPFWFTITQHPSSLTNKHQQLHYISRIL